MHDKNSTQKISNKEIDLIPIFEVSLEMLARWISILNIDLNKSKSNEFVV